MSFTIKLYLYLNCVLMLNWIVWNRSIFIKMDLALNNLQLKQLTNYPLNGHTRAHILTGTTQECCKQYWTSPGGNTPQSSSCTTTDHPSRKLSKLDKQDMRYTAGVYGRAHKWCTPVDLLTWTSKGRTTSSNLHTAAKFCGITEERSKRILTPVILYH